MNENQTVEKVSGVFTLFFGFCISVTVQTNAVRIYALLTGCLEMFLEPSQLTAPHRSDLYRNTLILPNKRASSMVSCAGAELKVA